MLRHGDEELEVKSLAVQPDVFTPENGYPEATVDGIPLRDRIWLAREP